MKNRNLVPCPEHGGGFDCSPFCRTCGGEQHTTRNHDFSENQAHAWAAEQLERYDVSERGEMGTIVSICSRAWDIFQNPTDQECENFNDLEQLRWVHCVMDYFVGDPSQIPYTWNGGN